MDLVVLVAELSQKRDKSFKELDKELLHRGYSSEEIEQALFWMSSQWHPVDKRSHGSFSRPAFRVLSPWETMCLEDEAYGYLLRLQNLGIIDAEQFERIMKRIVPYSGERLQIADIKALAGIVIFHLNADDGDDDFFQGLDDEIQVT